MTELGVLPGGPELEKVIPSPQPRSKTWLSTCYPLDTEEPGAELCGVDYQVRQTRQTSWMQPEKSLRSAAAVFLYISLARFAR